MSDAGATPGSALARAKPIFLAVREIPSPLREEELDRLCAGDAQLRRVVEVLLAGERAPLRYETLADEIVAARNAMVDAGQHADAGTRIGPYRVLEKIGEGGFGVVYMAEQEEPVRRRVALKILKLGMDTRQIVARFEAERQALAMMDHPAIARVLDAGATRSGRPYFVMELVRGEPITAYCDRRSLPIAERLRIFRLVCDGVQHAHQKGVIHRDLKPGNILVGDVDGRPAPKIIDFGIAKAISQRLTEKTLFTEFRQMIGTPEYMSPEQAEPGGTGDRDIDTRADVYSLGVILYEMLAGAPPFDAQRLRSAAYGEMQRIIREEDPPRPSTRLGTLAALPSVAARRTIEPGELGSMLRGELDWIVMKCLDKDRERRYGSAAELGLDVARFLEHQPVAARPASRAYTLRKFARRHRAGVVVGAGFAALLAAGITGTAAGLVSAVRANRDLDTALTDAREQRDLAMANERRAATELARTRELTRFLRSMLKSAGPAVARGRDTAVLRELLDDALRRIDAGELRDEPIVEAEMRAAIADTLKTLGDNAAALRVIEPALRMADAAPAGEDAAYLRARQTAAALFTEWQRDDEAVAQLDRIMEARQRAGLAEDQSLAEIFINYATILVRRGRPEEALEMYARARAVQERVFGANSPNVAATLGNMAGLLTNLNRHDEALADYRRLIEVCEAMEPSPLMHLAIITNNTAALLVEMGKYTEAEAMARRSLDLCARIYKADHQQAGMSWHTLGSALAGGERHEESREAFARAAAILSAAFDDRHPFVSAARIRLARELTALRRYSDAEELLLATYGVLERAGDADNARIDECVEALRDLYAEWEKADPGKGFLGRADRFKPRVTVPAERSP